jgi:hypothetical protein
MIQLRTPAGLVAVGLRPLAGPDWTNRADLSTTVLRSGTVLVVDRSDQKVHMTRPDGTTLDVFWGVDGGADQATSIRLAQGYDAVTPLVRRPLPPPPPPMSASERAKLRKKIEATGRASKSGARAPVPASPGAGAPTTGR